MKEKTLIRDENTRNNKKKKNITTILINGKYVSMWFLYFLSNVSIWFSGFFEIAFQFHFDENENHFHLIYIAHLCPWINTIKIMWETEEKKNENVK